MNLNIIPLDDSHLTSHFTCGVDEVDQFLKIEAWRYAEERYAVTFVAIDCDGDPALILGYYAVAVSQIAVKDAPNNKKVNGAAVPVVRILNLGVNVDHKRQRIGETLLFHAFQRAALISEHAGCAGVDLLADNADAVAFYTRYGMYSINKSTALHGYPHLFIQLSTIKKMDIGA